MITDVKIIPLSIKIIFFAARARITIIATLGRMIGITLDESAPTLADLKRNGAGRLGHGLFGPVGRPGRRARRQLKGWPEDWEAENVKVRSVI